MTETEKRIRIIEECKAALSAAAMGHQYNSVYDSDMCPTCGPSEVDGLQLEDICAILDQLKTEPIK